MGCGTSRRVSVDEKEAHKGDVKDSDTDSAFQEEDVIKATAVPSLNGTAGGDAESDKADFGKSSPFLKNSLSDEEQSDQPVHTPIVPRKTSFEKVSRSPELQERINVLTARRRARSLSEEDALFCNDNHNSGLHPNGVPASPHGNSTPELPRNDSPRTRHTFSLCHQSEVPSPFGQRTRHTLSDSQQEFFRMLDEKIAQGKDYCSEDEKSISSLVSRQSTGKLSYRRLFMPLHARWWRLPHTASEDCYSDMQAMQKHCTMSVLCYSCKMQWIYAVSLQAPCLLTLFLGCMHDSCFWHPELHKRIVGLVIVVLCRFVPVENYVCALTCQIKFLWCNSSLRKQYNWSNCCRTADVFAIFNPVYASTSLLVKRICGTHHTPCWP